jgi:acyl-[acyl-carrier-protein] desaturase
MKEVEITTQHLIADGFDIGTDRDPYKNFVYTSFQELATYISHNRVAKMAREYGSTTLSRMCRIISGDEMRHHKAYSTFVDEIFKVDPSNMMIAFKEMMVHKIVMPAHFLRESGQTIGAAFEDFSNSAQRIGVYTAQDYIDILQSLIDTWDIANINNLTDEAEKARDYLMKLPARMERVAQRMKIPAESHTFKWVQPALVGG